MCGLKTGSVVNTSDIPTPNKMPLDYTSYLLSASPPGFEVHYKNYVLLRDGLDLNGMGRAHQNGFYPVKPVITKAGELKRSESDLRIDVISSGEYPPKPERTSRSLDSLPIKQEGNPFKKGKKNVSFADENGYALSTVRIFTESSNSPPVLRKGFLSSLTNGATAGVTDTPPLVLKFSQPASDYVKFREKLDAQNVSLENVILKDYNLLGTVKVKNISFEKKVILRCTYDGWESHSDIEATYVPNRQTNICSPYDTFSFEINVPPNFDAKKSIQFAVCFQSKDKEFWDNNDGSNYVVTSTDWNSVTDTENSNEQNNSQHESPVFNLNSDFTNWTEFSSWSSNNSSIPYW